MLTGVRGVGKTTTARILARALNYETETVRPADRRHAGARPPLRRHHRVPPSRRDRDGRRLEHRHRQHPRDHRERALQAAARAHKVFVIDEVHMLSKGAFNALLEDAGGAARAREVHLRHHRDPQGAGHGALALPALRPAPRGRAAADQALRQRSPPTKAQQPRPRPCARSRVRRKARCATACRSSTRRSPWARATSRVDRGARHAGSCRPRPHLRSARARSCAATPLPRWFRSPPVHATAPSRSRCWPTLPKPCTSPRE